jgi:hypothetical protein
LAVAEFIPECFMVFDVESLGLHGDAFAVGWVVIDRAGRELDRGLVGTNPTDILGTDGDRLWVKHHVPSDLPWRSTPRQMRDAFWSAWRYWSSQRPKAVLVADCGWPVEARFLAACVDDEPTRRHAGPYPLHELASFLVAAGMDPLATYEREEDELPKHNPLADARQSARLLVTALDKLQARARRAEEADRGE